MQVVSARTEDEREVLLRPADDDPATAPALAEVHDGPMAGRAGGHDAVAGVILAAGEGRRFGGRKQLAELDGRAMLEHVLALADGAGLRPVVAVVPVWLSRPATMDDTSALRWVRNPYPGRGMSHSLRLGFAAVPETVAAAVILLGDQPRIPLAHIHALIAGRGTRPMVATAYRDGVGAPTLIERSQFEEVEHPRGDTGLRELLNARPELVLRIPLPGEPVDVDTLADLERLRGG